MRLVSGALALVSTLALGAVGWVAVARAGHPFELEWMEGGMLQHVGRVLAGEALYVRPTLDFMAYPYTPLFVYASAATAELFGPGFLALRVVSIVATLACFALLFQIVRREAGGPLPGLVATGLFAAAYDFTGAWLDVARVDTLSLALLLAGVALAQRGCGAIGAARGAAVGVLLFLAFLAKQSALGPAAGVVVGLAVVRNVRGALGVLGGLLLPLVASTLWLDALTDGWYRWHVFELLAGHPIYRPHVVGFWAEVAVSLGPAFAVALWMRLGGQRMDRYPLAVAASLILSSWIARMHVGGFDNTLIPAAAAAAMLAGIALGQAAALPERRRTFVGIALLAQFAMLVWDPRARIPTEADRAAGERIVAELSGADGEVWVPYHGYLAERAGHSAGAHAMPILDLLQGRDVETAQAFVAELTDALDRRRWSLIVLDDLSWEQDLPPLREHYARTRVLLDPGRPDVFRPRTGEPLRPVYVYEPR